jgi:hypothetical protein
MWRQLILHPISHSSPPSSTDASGVELPSTQIETGKAQGANEGRPNTALQPTPVGRVRVRRVPALDGILRERGAAERQAVRRLAPRRRTLPGTRPSESGTFGPDRAWSCSRPSWLALSPGCAPSSPDPRPSAAPDQVGHRAHGGQLGELRPVLVWFERYGLGRRRALGAVGTEPPRDRHGSSTIRARPLDGAPGLRSSHRVGARERSTAIPASGRLTTRCS